jgi:LCP family protein required for cell wall assembly
MGRRGYSDNGNTDWDETQVYGQGWLDGQDTGGYDTQGSYGDDQDYDGYDGYDDDWQEADDYQEEPYYQETPAPMTMAARAAGKANTEPYGRPRGAQRPRQQSRQAPRQQYHDYDTGRRPARPRRRKRHRLRNFLIFLLLLAALVGIGYVTLFPAPAQTEDGVHTRKAGFYNILIAATDEGGNRTDTIMLATLDGKNGTVSLTSIPRDTIVSNGASVPKLNGVYGMAGAGTDGAEALLDTVETLLGFRPDGYAIIDYQVFNDAVDALGGVTFQVPMDMTVDDPDTGEPIDLYAGEQVLDGDQALAVCRYRYGYLMADIQRQYVQQTFLKAMIQQCMAPSSWTKLPAVYQAVMDNMITDLSGGNLRYLALKALLTGLDDIPQNTLPGEGVDYNGASCYGLYGQSVVDMVNEVMNPYEEEITIDDVYILTVSDGSLVESTWRGVAFDASTYEYD